MEIILNPLVVVLLLLFLLISLLLSFKVKFSWLQLVSNLLIFTLPFERIPSLEISFGTVKIGQILVLIAFYFFLLLLLKKDPDIYQFKFIKSSFWVLGLIVFSIPSWFFTQSLNRFLSTSIATLLVLGGFFLISNFATNITLRIRQLVLVMTGVSIFSWYQWIGDLIGLPFHLTGMYYTYSKAIFGIPRSIGTALEPQHLANFLFLMIFTLLVLTLYQKPIFTFQENKSLNFTNFKTQTNFNYFQVFFFKSIWLKNQIWQITAGLIKNRYFNFFLLAILLSVFFLTISKAAISILLLIGLILVVLISIQERNFYAGKIYFQILSILALILANLALYSQRIYLILKEVWDNFYGTLFGETATILERQEYVRVFNYLIDQFWVTGIGSGQYGVWAQKILRGSPFLPKNGYLIVNNAYLEVWLEFGVFSLVIFILALLYPLIFLSLKVFQKTITKSAKESKMYAWILLATLFSMLIQWNFFSPVYYMPTMIVLGICYNFLKTQDKHSIYKNIQS